MLLSRAAELARDFDLGADDAAYIADHLVRQLRAGLACDGATQIPSFVTSVPNGSEKGTYLAVDLGGTNCRICMVHLDGNGTYTTTQSKHAVPRDIRVNPSYKPLFAFIAEKIRDFLRDHAVTDFGNQTSLQLGFTFSFTYVSHSLSSGTVVQWDKGWDIPDALGRDPCKMLQEAMDDLHLAVRVSALTNDSVGTLMSRAYSSPWSSATLLGAIFGTGTNAAYVESVERISKLDTMLQARANARSGVMVVNTEWGALCDSPERLLKKSCFDDALDSASSNPGNQLLEKQISGLYLGELMRLVIVSLLEQSLFDMTLDEGSPVLMPYTIDTSFLSRILVDASDSLTEATQEICTTLKARKVSLDDVRALIVIATALVKRSARLSGLAIAAIIIQSGRLRDGNTNPESSLSKTESKPIVSEDEITSSTSRAENGNTNLRPLVRFVRNLLSCFTTSTRPELVAPLKEVTYSPTDVSEDEQNIIDIGIDGSLFECCPKFEHYLRTALHDIPQIGAEGEERVRIGLAKDGSSVGAALVACAAA